MRVRPAKKSDLNDVMRCVSRLKEEYFEKNEIPQWLGDYPSKEIFEGDIEANRLFVMYMGECLIGFASIGIGDDPNYAVIEGDGWKGDGKYAVVHRFGISPDWHRMGMGTALLGLADKLCEANDVKIIRADTHELNAGMLGLLKKNGFETRGTIYLENGDPRVALEKIL